MKVQPLPDGRPSQHLGIGHTLKHYVAPAECWQDLEPDFPGSIPATARPNAVREGLPAVEPPAWQSQVPHSPEVVAHWTQLRVPYREGYLSVVQHFAHATPSPDEAPSDWVCTGHRSTPTRQLGATGILLRVQRNHGTWQLYSAFRPAGFHYFEKHCPPADPTLVRLRRQVASIRASSALDRWRTDGDHP